MLDDALEQRTAEARLASSGAHRQLIATDAIFHQRGDRLAEALADVAR